MITPTCPICNRPLGTILVNEHHLIPRTFKGKETVSLHQVCHRKLHSLLTEREMLNYYNTIPRILEHEEVKKFVVWIAKKPPEYYSSSDETASRKGKRRS